MNIIYSVDRAIYVLCSHQNLASQNEYLVFYSHICEGKKFFEKNFHEYVLTFHTHKIQGIVYEKTLL